MSARTFQCRARCRAVGAASTYLRCRGGGSAPCRRASLVRGALGTVHGGCGEDGEKKDARTRLRARFQCGTAAITTRDAVGQRIETPEDGGFHMIVNRPTATSQTAHGHGAASWLGGGGFHCWGWRAEASFREPERPRVSLMAVPWQRSGSGDVTFVMGCKYSNVSPSVLLRTRMRGRRRPYYVSLYTIQYRNLPLLFRGRTAAATEIQFPTSAANRP